MNLPWKKEAVQYKVVVLQRELSALRLVEWRADPDLCSAAAKVLAMPDLRTMLQVVQNEHPGNLVARDDVPMDVRAVLQARAEGYTIALANLKAMSEHIAPPVDLVEEFSYNP